MVVGEIGSGYDWIFNPFVSEFRAKRHEIGCNFSFFFFFRGYFVGGCYFWKIIFNTFDSKIDILSSIFATYLSKDFSGGEKKKRKMEEE